MKRALEILNYIHLYEGTGKPWGRQKMGKSVPVSYSEYLNFNSGVSLGARVPTGSTKKKKTVLILDIYLKDGAGKPCAWHNNDITVP